MMFDMNFPLMWADSTTNMFAPIAIVAQYLKTGREPVFTNPTIDAVLTQTSSVFGTIVVYVI
jgi:hypothetical protein